MECENIEVLWNIFNHIDIEDNAESKNEKDINRYNPKSKLRRILPNPIDFEKYVQENCDNKFKILDRSTFHEIRRPIVIFFNHFSEKCAYHTKWLDLIYQLALKYGGQIEFIAADMSDIDVIYHKLNPYNFYCRIVRPEDETPFIYVIDEKKRTQHSVVNKTVENLSELCENLLKGCLYPSQPIPKNNDTNLVKICVYDNYEELVLKSSRDIFLIVGYGEYKNKLCEPNYENVALELKDYNVDIVYMEAEVNYVPFEYINNIYYPILFIPHNDKTNFIYFEEDRTDEHVIEFLKKIRGHPNFLKLKQEEQQARYYSGQNSLRIPKDFEMDFNNLPQFLKENFNSQIHVLDRKTLNKIKTCIIIVYMNFQGKCLAHHVRWLNKIYTIAERSCSTQYLVADFKDIDLINSKWTPSTFLNNAANLEDDIPKIFAMDYLKHTYEFTNYTTPASLFYFESSLSSGDFYYSQRYPRNQDGEIVKTCVADSLNVFIKQSKKDLFLTFYKSDRDNTDQLLQVLEDVAECVKDLNVEVAKFNTTENYVDLQYAHPTYPVHYFIPRHNKKENYILTSNGLNREEILKFIKNVNIL